MEIILKHLQGDEQYRFLQALLEVVIESPNRKAEVIQKIMDEINGQ